MCWLMKVNLKLLGEEGKEIVGELQVKYWYEYSSILEVKLTTYNN